MGMNSRLASRSFLKAVTIAMLIAGLAAAGPVAAATLVVTACTDTVPGGVPGELRAAITAANSGDAIDVSGCENIILAGTPNDDSNQTGDLDINKSLTIEGATRPTVIAAGGIDRVFDISVGVTVVLRNLRIQGGDATKNAIGSKAGGAIFNDGTLTPENVLITGNKATQGGGIFNNGQLELNGVTISVKTATDDGGGILINAGIVTATNVTISGNTATTDGGGIDNMSSTLGLTTVT